MSRSAAPGFAEHLANNYYFDRQFETEAVKVLPGEYYVTKTDMVLVTVLGSCVSACLRDRELGLGGMNHFMLAESSETYGVSASARYGSYAMEVLINHLLKLGARRNKLEAKVFGGGRVMASLISSQGSTQCQISQNRSVCILKEKNKKRRPPCQSQSVE